MAITVTRLSVTAVKGTRIREVDTVTLDAHGARGDRAFYVVDADGEMVNGKRLAMLQTVVADYDIDGGQLALRFADGHEARAPVRLGEMIDSRFFSGQRRGRVLDGPWSEALSSRAGQPLRLVATDSAVDRGRRGATSLISRGSLRRLAEADGGIPIDARRFRMLIEIDGIEAHGEDDWIGRAVRVGEARLHMHGNVGRCMITTRDPDSGDVDLPTLKMLAGYRRDDIETTEPLPFGIYGEVLAGGVVRVGDAVEVAP